MIRVALCLVLVAAVAGCNQNKSVPAAGDQVLASVAGKQVVLRDIEQAFPDVFLRMRQQEYRNMMSFLEAYLLKEAVTADAKAAGKTLEEYVQARMKIRPVTDADIARMDPRFGSDPDELRRVLTRHRQDEARRDAIHELLSAKGVKIALEPPRFAIPVTIDDAVRGRPDAPITIVEFSDFTCGFCALSRPTVERILEKYNGDVRVVFKHAPRNGEGARLSQFAMCAKDAGMFWQAHDYLFATPAESVDDAIARARTHLKLPDDKVTQCMASEGTWARLERERKLAETLGVRGTPTFFVNGMLVPYTNFFGDFSVLVDRERARLGRG